MVLTSTKSPIELTESSSCAFYISNRGDSLCSETSIISKMHEIVMDTNSSNISNKTKLTDDDALNIAKEITGCKTEACVMNNEYITKHIGKKSASDNLLKNFKPRGPWDSQNWLSNFDIDSVLKQYSIKFKNFKTITCQMIDFNLKKTELSFDKNYLDCLSGDQTCFGAVINTDPSGESGQHWFCVFFDFRNDNITLEYYNSSGTTPPMEISLYMNDLVNKITKDITTYKNIPDKYRIYKNKNVKFIKVATTEHQFDSYSCGVYSLYYIICRLNDIKWEYFAEYRTPDEFMHHFRTFIFRKDD
jgi:hypothetical protein